MLGRPHRTLQLALVKLFVQHQNKLPLDREPAQSVSSLATSEARTDTGGEIQCVCVGAESHLKKITVHLGFFMDRSLQERNMSGCPFP